MNQIEYIRNPWWEMYDSHEREQRERQRVLVREQREVRNEMIQQEYASGKKAKTLAYEFGMNETTIRDICKGVRKWKVK